jgi:NAD(P)-dependent dehydrogenase (short-subunit alcohol dehydrogenase family)
MRIVVIGASGTIGSAVADLLAVDHTVIRVGRSSGDRQVDLASRDSIEALFRSLDPVDAVVSAAGEARFAPLDTLTDADFAFSLGNKLMGQINLVRIGHPYVADGGSFTLTSGILARQPMLGSAAISLVNAGIEGFVGAAALELPRGLRINVVSPPWVTETLKAMGMEPTHGLPADRVALAYRAAVEGTTSGEVLDPRLVTQ